MPQLKGDERLPRYQRLADVLRQEISQGARSPGDRVPSENELSEQYGLAPGTARQAVAQLVAEGVLERFHGKGTYVRKPSFDHALLRFFRFRGLNREGSGPQSRILGREIAHLPDAPAEGLQIEAGTPAIHISRLRLFDDSPVLVEEIWLPLALFRPLLELPVEDFGPLLYPLYEDCCDQVIAYADEELTAEAAEQTTAELLGIAPGAPVIVIERLSHGFDDTALEWRRSWGRADQFHYHTRIR